MGQVTRIFGDVCLYCGIAAVVGISAITAAVLAWISFI